MKYTKKFTVQAPVLPLAVCCVFRQDTLSTLVLFHKDKIGSRLRLEINLRWTGVPDFHPINTT